MHAGRFALWVALAGACAGATACDKPEARSALNYTADAKRAYDAAMVEFDGHNWIEAQNLFREVKRKYGYSRYARLAELRIADADYEQEKYAEAIRQYKQFVHDHRSDVDEVTYARARIAESEYKQISESLLLPSADERDQASIVEAYKELKSFLHDYPDAKQTARMRELLEDASARLVRHELYVARFYLRRDNFEAAVSRVQFALRNYSAGDPPVIVQEKAPRAPLLMPNKPRGTPNPVGIDSQLEAEALLLLGETYLKMHKYTDAREAFETIVREYARTALTVAANRYLDYMKTRGV